MGAIATATHPCAGRSGSIRRRGRRWTRTRGRASRLLEFPYCGARPAAICPALSGAYVCQSLLAKYWTRVRKKIKQLSNSFRLLNSLALPRGLEPLFSP